MRIPFVLLTSLSCLLATAQVDINKIMQQRAGGGQGAGQGQGNSGGPGTGVGPGNGMHMQDDNDPFVPNTFTGSFRMEIHTYKGTEEMKGSPMNMRYWSKPDMTVVQMEMPEQRGQQMRTLTDLKGKWTYTLLVDDKGKKTAMKSRKKKVMMAPTPEGAKEPTVEWTGEKKTIEGRSCEKVIVTTDKGKWTGWVAKGVKAPFADMTRHVQQRGGGDHMRGMEKLDGMTMEYEWVPNDGVQRVMCTVHDLVEGKVDESTFSLDGYEVMEMPGFGR